MKGVQTRFRLISIIIFIATLFAIAILGFLLVKFFGDAKWLPAITSLVTAAVLIVAGAIAYGQLRAIQRGQRAAVLTSLDNLWMSSEMKTARMNFLKFRNEVEEIREPGQRETFIREQLWLKKTTKERNYRDLVHILEFFEGVGYFARKDYISLEDTEELYGPAIRTSKEIFSTHIKDLQDREKDTTIYQNFLWLADKLKR